MSHRGNLRERKHVRRNVLRPSDRPVTRSAIKPVIETSTRLGRCRIGADGSIRSAEAPTSSALIWTRPVGVHRTATQRSSLTTRTTIKVNVRRLSGTDGCPQIGCLTVAGMEFLCKNRASMGEIHTCLVLFLQDATCNKRLSDAIAHDSSWECSGGAFDRRRYV